MARLKSMSHAYKGTLTKPAKLGYCTLAWTERDDDGTGAPVYILKHHKTYVFIWRPQSGRLSVSHGGWQSKTTAQRIRHGLNMLGLELLTSDLPGRWRIATKHGDAFTMRGNSLTLRRYQLTNTWERV